MSIRILKSDPTISPVASMGPARAIGPPPELARAVFYSSIPLESLRDDSRKPSVDAGPGHPIDPAGVCSTDLREASLHGVVNPALPQAHGGSPVPFVTAADLIELGAILLIGAGILALLAILYL